MAEKTVKVKTRVSMGNPGWQAEKGDVVELPLSDARRMIARGLAEEIDGQPLPKATPEEIAAARVRDVETTESIRDKDNQLEVGIRYAPRDKGKHQRLSLVKAGRVED